MIMVAAPILTVATVLGTALPASASADNCGTNGDTGVYNCMYISGSGLYASEIRGWSMYDATGYPVHEEVVAPLTAVPDEVICNSSTVTPYDPGTVVGCQEYDKTLPVSGDYCSILWEYRGGKYLNMAENCVDVFS
jgi:hypothetical protein